MAGGGEHSHGGDFRAKVWSMSGGPYCRPKHWQRNTAIALAGIVLICIPVALKSAELETLVSEKSQAIQSWSPMIKATRSKGHIFLYAPYLLSSGARILE